MWNQAHALSAMPQLFEWGVLDGTLADRYFAATHCSMAMLVGNTLNPVNFIERG